MEDPWMVTAVEKELAKETETATACVRSPERMTVRSAQCGKACGLRDRLPERTWRHLSVMQYTLELRCEVRWCECPEQGVKPVRLPWAEPGPLLGAVRSLCGGVDRCQRLDDVCLQADPATLGQRAAAGLSSGGAWAGAAFDRGRPVGQAGREEFPPCKAARVADDRAATVPGAGGGGGARSRPDHGAVGRAATGTV
jgi:hypothetical protein